ncbi:YrdB family protein [Paenibacillus sp. B01]|uniref:YrdB family protein n=1 Tax=Paenibacillus sp. B01 TaxID=2660554 RepID=UPI00129A5C5C|nr:YrdB family protein [Paenibacillus sp. B01]QGG57828.1 DUF2568 domain-containing protein [Paenibacillus sp. B01]
MEAIKMINLGVRFFLELALLAALGIWGFQTGFGSLVRWLLGIGAPLLTAVVWGAFLSPKASIPLDWTVKLAMELLLFGLGALALWAASRPTWAVAILVIWAINRILLAVWEQ